MSQQHSTWRRSRKPSTLRCFYTVYLYLSWSILVPHKTLPFPPANIPTMCWCTLWYVRLITKNDGCILCFLFGLRSKHHKQFHTAKAARSEKAMCRVFGMWTPWQLWDDYGYNLWNSPSLPEVSKFKSCRHDVDIILRVAKATISHSVLLTSNALTYR